MKIKHKKRFENIQMCWIERYKNKGNVNIKLLVDEINKNKTITLYELNQKLKDKYKDANF